MNVEAIKQALSNRDFHKNSSGVSKLREDLADVKLFVDDKNKQLEFQNQIFVEAESLYAYIAHNGFKQKAFPKDTEGRFIKDPAVIFHELPVETRITFLALAYLQYRMETMNDGVKND